MSGILYVVATPIGNLDDLTYRAVKTLQEVEFIAAEDTRVTVKILNHLNIKKPMVSYHEHNLEKGDSIIQRILNGENCALCCDAGTPAISDPGQVLVQQAHESGVKVVPIPGPSASIVALSAGGQDTGRFAFEGFISVNKKQRQERLEELKTERRTMVFYEAPHKLPATLKDFEQTFGAERPITIAREITKIYEEIYITTIGEALLKYEEEKPRGEFVLLVAGAQPEKKKYTINEAVEIAKELLEKGKSTSYSAKQAAQETGLPKGEIYKILSQETP